MEKCCNVRFTFEVILEAEMFAAAAVTSTVLSIGLVIHWRTNFVWKGMMP